MNIIEYTKIIEEYFDTPLKVISARGRAYPLVHKRHMYIFFAKKYKFSTALIAYMVKRNETTINKAVKCIQNDLDVKVSKTIVDYVEIEHLIKKALKK